MKINFMSSKDNDDKQSMDWIQKVIIKKSSAATKQIKSLMSFPNRVLPDINQIWKTQ